MLKVIIKGRSSTMRHVSRTHRVALDWLFDRINLDPKIPASRTRRNSRLDEAPSSQVKMKDVYFGGLMDESAGELVATERIRYYGNFLLNPGAFMKMK